MLWLLDSNVLIDALAGMPHGVRVLREARSRPNVSLAYSAMTRIEVLGFPNLGPQEETAFRSLFAQFGEIPVSNAVVEQTIAIRKTVPHQDSGRPDRRKRTRSASDPGDAEPE
jgi:predicted nucleic acid-binding protein